MPTAELESCSWPLAHCTLSSCGRHPSACGLLLGLAVWACYSGVFVACRRTAHREGPVTKDGSGAQDEQHGGIWVIRRWVGETWGGRQGDVAYLPGQVRRPCGCTRLGKGMRVRRIEAGLAREIRSGVPRWAAGDTRIGQRGTAGHVVHRPHHRGTQEPRLTRSGGKDPRSGRATSTT